MLGVAERELRKAFRQHLGVTPRQFQQSARLNRAKEALRGSSNTLDALYAAGYGSVRGLYEAGPARMGMTPGVFARKGKGLTLGVEIAQHALGLLVVAGTERGVSFVGVGECRESLEAELRRDYGLATIVSPGPPRWIAAVLAALENPHNAHTVPLDVYATAFQARVWEALQRIPPGETRTYSGLATALGDAKATRAVARACATNCAAILIPCHRVVGADGSLTGYRWGLDRKRRLLESERNAAQRAD
ncbi:MAG: methylated-DNA--[protein]-cysteine S-methyltransferase [Bryobacterales bacterium]|nr:methylated-DNA--[protein]-cysteine S-methyltransferase [Bryobacterales bacterium]